MIKFFWSIPHIFFHNAIAWSELNFIFKNKNITNIPCANSGGDNEDDDDDDDSDDDNRNNDYYDGVEYDHGYGYDYDDKDKDKDDDGYDDDDNDDSDNADDVVWFAQSLVL